MTIETESTADQQTKRPSLSRRTKIQKSKGSEQSPRTMGPVPDLERHLPQDWWRTLFNSVYLKTDGDVVENEEATRQELDAILSATGFTANDRILDLCCGQGRHTLGLARRGFKNLTGVDRSRFLVRLAKRRAKQDGLNVSFHEGDARRFRVKSGEFHGVMILGNSFGYFDQEADDQAVLRSVSNALASGGTLVLDLADGDWQREHFEPRSWEWIDGNHFVCRERSLSADRGRLISREVVVHAERGVIVDQFYAERLYSASSILELLEDCGFTQCRVHQQIEADSTRQQDLGMMACRMLITAQSKRSTPRPSGKKPKFEKISVLLGDPRLPDTIKRDGTFNPEDLATIQKLKDALQELDQFEFTYSDNHASLLNDLRAKPPEFVFNLCDEGYNNEAFKELHVPAVLELLDVPYTGAGPTTLGVCYNKSFVRSIAETMDVPVPLETFFASDDQAATIPSIFPSLVKPAFGDSSIGITEDSVVTDSNGLMSRIEQLRNEFPGIPLLIQEFLAGNEYSVGVIGNPGHGFNFLPVLEVDFSGLDHGLPKILGYESKWIPDSPYWNQIKYHEADLDDDTIRQLNDHSSRLFERLGCRDYARFDFRADAHGCIKLLEVNPNPGWCWDGKLNFMAEYAGMRYPELLLSIIEAGQARYHAANSRK